MHNIALLSIVAKKRVYAPETHKKIFIFSKSHYILALLNFWLNFHKWIFSVYFFWLCDFLDI